MKTVFLIDTRCDGHHSTYMKFFAKAIIDLGSKVVLLCPNPDEITEWIKTNSNSSENFISFYFNEKNDFTPTYNIPLINTIESIKFHTEKFAKLNSIIAEISKKNGLTPDLVYFLYLDNYLTKNNVIFFIDKIFNYKWSGLYFTAGNFLINNKKKLLEKIMPFRSETNILNSKNCQSIYILNEYAQECLKHNFNKKICIFPDFADNCSTDSSFEPAVEIKNKARGRKIIGLIGAIDRRKSILTLIQSSKLVNKEEFFFVIAGKLYEKSFTENESKFILDFAKNPPENFCFYLQTIPDESKFNALINACDYLFASYIDFPHSSNILTKAAIFKKNIITSNRYCMAERNIKYELGITAKEEDASDTAKAFITLSQNNKLKSDFNEYIKFHSVETLNQKIQELLN